MLGNFSQTYLPIKRLVEAGGFNFIVLQYDHYKIFELLQAELRKDFPDQSWIYFDAQTVTYESFMAGYREQAGGFIFLSDVDELLDWVEGDRLSKEIEAENERKNGILRGVNIRRDLLTQFPVQLIFVFSPWAQENLIADLRKAIPDLWSMRSFEAEFEVSDLASVNQSEPWWGLKRPEQVELEIPFLGVRPNLDDQHQIWQFRLGGIEEEKSRNSGFGWFVSDNDPLKEYFEKIGLYTHWLNTGSRPDLSSFHSFIEPESQWDYFFDRMNPNPYLSGSFENRSPAEIQEIRGSIIDIISEIKDNNYTQPKFFDFEIALAYWQLVLGYLYLWVGRKDKAIPELKSSIQLTQALLQDFPQNVQFQAVHECTSAYLKALGNNPTLVETV